MNSKGGGTIVAWCTLTTADNDTQVRLRVSDGAWEDTAEAAGDGSQPLSYSGEVVTVMATWTPGEGVYDVACEGRYASAYDAHLVVLVMP